MGTSYGTRLQVDGLQLSLDVTNPKAYSTGAWYNMLDGRRFNNDLDPSWANNISELTITLVWNKITTVIGYANHPINKWNNSYLDNSSFILYNFGTGNGAGVDLVGWYGNTTAAAGSGWTGISAQSAVSNGLHHIAFQYNWINGGQLWIDGVKIGGRTSSGKLGQTSVVTNTSVIGINGPEAGTYDRVISANFYSLELSDDIVREDYLRSKRKHNLP